MRIELNCLGEVCPIPLVKTKKALRESAQGDVITVLADNVETVENIEKMVKNQNYPYEIGNADGYYTITICKDDASERMTGMSDSGAADTQSFDRLPKGFEGIRSEDFSVLVLSSDKMGEGDPVLGLTLMKMFLYALTETEPLPKSIVCYNAGVLLSANDAQAAAHLKTLSDRGVDILSCGACMKHYNLASPPLAGRVSNMQEIAGLLMKATRVIKP